MVYHQHKLEQQREKLQINDILRAKNKDAKSKDEYVDDIRNYCGLILSFFARNDVCV